MLAVTGENPYRATVVARILAKSLRRFSESLGALLHRAAEGADTRLRSFAERVDRHMGRESHADGRPSASAFESLQRLVEQIYKNLHRKKRRSLKEVLDVCVMALEAPVINDVHMAELIRTQRLQRSSEQGNSFQADRKRTRIQLPPRKIQEEVKPPGSSRLKKASTEES